jgi:hypothetical protein
VTFFDARTVLNLSSSGSIDIRTPQLHADYSPSMLDARKPCKQLPAAARIPSARSGNPRPDEVADMD